MLPPTAIPHAIFWRIDASTRRYFEFRGDLLMAHFTAMLLDEEALYTRAGFIINGIRISRDAALLLLMLAMNYG